jgi:photosystem I subunit 3
MRNRCLFLKNYVRIYISNSNPLKFFIKLKMSNFILTMKRFNLIALIFTVLLAFTPDQALADIGGLTKCSESPAFSKRLKTSVKKLEQRMAQYEADSPPALALQQQIGRTNVRFDKYSRSDLLCGTDGLPHLIADGRWSHAAEFILPGFGFIYISGWIGWVGRKYVRAVSTTKNPAESEIIINVPLALKIMTTGYIWPISAWQELVSNKLVAPKDEITVSPR